MLLGPSAGQPGTWNPTAADQAALDEGWQPQCRVSMALAQLKDHSAPAVLPGFGRAPMENSPESIPGGPDWRC
jgi:hypothetical protein